MNLVDQAVTTDVVKVNVAKNGLLFTLQVKTFLGFSHVHLDVALLSRPGVNVCSCSWHGSQAERSTFFCMKQIYTIAAFQALAHSHTNRRYYSLHICPSVTPH